jgi:hypothetical protein
MGETYLVGCCIERKRIVIRYNTIKYIVSKDSWQDNCWERIVPSGLMWAGWAENLPRHTAYDKDTHVGLDPPKI